MRKIGQSSQNRFSFRATTSMTYLSTDSTFFFKISATDVCGCPLVTNVFEETGDFCRASKRRCMKHYCWEKLRRAEIDLQRIQQVCYFLLFMPERNQTCL